MLFWGAGATVSLGIRTTQQEAEFLRQLAPAPGRGKTPSLRRRVRSALGAGFPRRWVDALYDLLCILGDTVTTPGRTPAHGNIGVEQLEAMGRNWESRDEEELRNRIVKLRGLYDWPALVGAINACPGQTSGTVSGSHASSSATGLKLLDLFNLLDMHLQSGHGFRGEDGMFLPYQRVLGARGALGLLIQSMFYVDWHVRARSNADLKHHYDFGLELGRRMQIRGQRLADGVRPETFEEREFVLGDVTVLSMNWDPIGLWAQILANRRLNRASNVPHVGSPARRMQLYHDLGYFIAGPRVEKDHLDIMD